jgi:formylglycine-generating enzyme required for sulfatase activity
VNDWYSSSYYSSSPQNNPSGPAAGSVRVCRGGSWFNFSDYCRASFRFNADPGVTGSFIGFRAARTP